MRCRNCNAFRPVIFSASHMLTPLPCHLLVQAPAKSLVGSRLFSFPSWETNAAIRCDSFCAKPVFGFLEVSLTIPSQYMLEKIAEEAFNSNASPLDVTKLSTVRVGGSKVYYYDGRYVSHVDNVHVQKSSSVREFLLQQEHFHHRCVLFNECRLTYVRR